MKFRLRGTSSNLPIFVVVVTGGRGASGQGLGKEVVAKGAKGQKVNE